MKVYIHNGNESYRHLFLSLGHEIVEEKESNLVVFTGGSDVTPSWYGHKAHPYTRSDLSRDEDDMACYERSEGKLVVGICRGAQFLHVMNGGTLYQDVDNHANVGGHVLTTVCGQFEWVVTSTHHQMMAPDAGEVLGVAEQSSYWDYFKEELKSVKPECGDVEVISHGNALCFQPHPEFHGAESTKNCFSFFLNKFLQEN